MHFAAPVDFVMSSLDGLRDLAEADDPPDPDTIEPRINADDGRNAWTLQTYLRLRRRGHDVRLVDRFRPGALCIAYCDDVLIRRRTYRSFVVAIQPDRPRSQIANRRVVQNHLRIEDPRTDFFTLLWPQPGILARDPARAERIERVGYLGRVQYLAGPFRSEAFRRALAGRGMELVVRETGWDDYRDLDAVLAVRDVTDFDLSLKPASKLVNAWLAGCVPLLGPEPAFRALRTDALDYLEVRTPDDALEALDQLRREPDLFRAMLEQGARRRPEVDAEAVTRAWEQLIAGPIMQGYLRWRRVPTPLRRAWDAARFPLLAARHRAARRHFFRSI